MAWKPNACSWNNWMSISTPQFWWTIAEHNTSRALEHFWNYYWRKWNSGKIIPSRALWLQCCTVHTVQSMSFLFSFFVHVFVRFEIHVRQLIERPIAALVLCLVSSHFVRVSCGCFSACTYLKCCSTADVRSHLLFSINSVLLQPNDGERSHTPQHTNK